MNIASIKESFTIFDFFRFQLYKIRVINGLKTLLLLFTQEGQQFYRYPEIKSVIREGFHNDWPLFKTIIYCASAMVEIVVKLIPPPDRWKLIQELPMLDFNLLGNFIREIRETGKVVFPQPLLPGTFMIGSIIFYAGALKLHNKISIEDCDAVMEQIYGILHDLPVELRPGVNYSSIIPPT